LTGKYVLQISFSSLVDSWLSQSHLNEKLEQKENLEHHLCTVVAKLKIQSARSWVEIQIEESGSCPRNLDIISVWIKLAGCLDYLPFEENQLIPFSFLTAIHAFTERSRFASYFAA